MILAVVDFVEKRGPQPPELKLKWRCDRYRALPDAGGVRDQEAGLLERLELADRAFMTWSLWQSRQPGHEGEWSEAHPEEWQMVMAIMEMLNERITSS